MSRVTPIYTLLAPEQGDKIYSYHEWRNLQVIENQIGGVFLFLGPGVLSGWDVHQMVGGDYTEGTQAAIEEDKTFLLSEFERDRDSYWGEQFSRLGLSPTLPSVGIGVTPIVTCATTEPVALLSGAQTLDGYTPLDEELVLVKDQESPKQNGIYRVSTSGAWSRLPLESNLLDLTEPWAIPLSNRSQALKVSGGETQSGTLWALAPYTGDVLDPDFVFFDPWRQVFRVTPGRGNVGIFRARTEQSAYFRLTQGNIFYTWAEASLCLTIEGLATITCPLDPQSDHDEYRTATYLGSVETLPAYEAAPYVVIDKVGREDRRVELRNLEGALRAALKKSFYRHVHLGRSDTPSKIQLGTRLVLSCTGPVGTTILKINFASGDSRDAASYGVPELRLNNVPLSATTYRLDFATGRVYLQNSLDSGDVIQLYLPLAPQVRLFAYAGDFSSDISITDGAQSRDAEGNLTYLPFLWDDGDYTEKSVRLSGEEVDPNLYTLDPLTGTLRFIDASTGDGYGVGDLSLFFTRVSLNKQVTGRLSGRRIGSIDAASFTTGKLDPRRLTTLDHVGQFRLREPASLRPQLRIFSGSADHSTFYPEIVGSPVQYDTEFYEVSGTANLGSALALTTKRGLMLSGTDYFTQPAGAMPVVTAPASWNVDNGRPVQVIDEVLDAEGGGNHFHITYIRTAEGRLFYTDNGGTTWRSRKLPTVPQVIEVEGVQNIVSVTPLVTAFYCASQRTEVETGPAGIVKDEWYSYLYLGTDYGLWVAEIKEGTSEDEWSWSRSSYWEDNHSTIHAIQEIATFGVQVPDEGPTTEWYDRTLYVGADSGFYVGATTRNAISAAGSDTQRVLLSGVVRGFHWVKGAYALNDLIFWSEDEAYVVHDAERVEESTGSSSQRYWNHPFHTLIPILSADERQDNSRVATLENITLSGLQTIDGFELNAEDRVLVRLQTDSTQNGIYVAKSGAWVRDEFALESGAWVRVAEGVSQGGSLWLIGLPESAPYVWGDTSVSWLPFWFRLVQEEDPEALFTITPLLGSNEYVFCRSTGLTRVIDGYDAETLTYLPAAAGQPTPVWNEVTQGVPRRVLVAYDASIARNAWFVASSSGIWRSDDEGQTWRRHVVEFSAPVGWEPTVSDAATTNEIMVDEYTFSSTRQSFDFSSVQPLYRNFVYERDYQDYYVTPWIKDATTEVVVEVNDSSPDVQYALYPEEGRIHFISSLRKSDTVRVSVTRFGAYVQNAGSIPHSEQIGMFLVSEEPLTTLSADFPPGDTPQALVISTKDDLLIPVTATSLELRSGINRQRVYISIDPETHLVRVVTPRALTDYTFPADRTQVYLVTKGSLLGIEDRLTKSTSDHTYHLHSVAGANIQTLALSSRRAFPGLFSNFTGAVDSLYADSVERGAKSALFFDFDQDKLDDRASSSSLYVGREPSPENPPTAPRVIYAIDGNLTSPTGLRIGSDQGVWSYDGTRWSKESDLDGATRVYFFATIGGLPSAGTERGLYQKSASGWFLNPAYPQAVYSYLSFTWGEVQDDKGNITTPGQPAHAFGKDDGIAFVKEAADGTFTSDHFDLVDGKNVYGLFKGKFFRLTDGDPPKQTRVDGLYLCTINGLYGVCDGDISGRQPDYAAFLTGREMFGSDRLSNLIELPSGGTACVPMRIYGLFQPPLVLPQNEVVTLFVLTNNGVYRVRNWRHCDPAENELTFALEKRHLDGQRCNTTDAPSIFEGRACYSHLGILGRAHPDDAEDTAKLFIGTDKGVYRSFNGGGDWDRCERIGGKDVSVYCLRSAGDCIVAGTDTGLWYTYDDGDNWLRTDIAPPSPYSACVGFEPTVSESIPFNGGSLTQLFQCSDESQRVTKVSLYLSRQEIDPENPEFSASMDNTLSVALHTVVDGEPGPSISEAVTLTNASLEWSAGYGASTGWEKATRLYDKESYDDTTFYSENSTGPSDAAGISARYVLTTSGPVTRLHFRVFYTQTLSMAFEVWDGSGWVNAIDNTIEFPDNGGSGRWFTGALSVEDLSLSALTGSIWRLSIQDEYAGVEQQREVRLGDFRLYGMGDIPYRLEEVFTAADIMFPGFRSFDLIVDLPDAEAEYALVATETVASGGLPILKWTKYRPFPESEEDFSDFLYRVYFDAPALPTTRVVDAGFLLGDGRGFAVTSDDVLTTDARLAAIFVVDDTISAGWSDPEDPISGSGARTRELPQFVQRLFDRTAVSLYGFPYSASYGDFWIFQNGELERTDGFDNRQEALEQFASALSARGKASGLFETSSIALSGVEPQSLVDAILKDDDESGNRLRCEQVMGYLSRDVSRDLLRLSDVATYYGQLSFKQQVDGGYWDLSAETLYNYPEPRQFVVERWAKGFTPVAFIVADGDDIGGGSSADDVVLAATSAWGDVGVNVHSLALGTSHSQANLRSISDGTGGKLFLLATGADASDWDAACDSFLHGGENSVFVASWNRTFDYDSPVWVRQVDTSYVTPVKSDITGVDSVCLVEVRWSKNRRDFSPWRAVSSGTSLVIDDALVSLEYRVSLRDGWSQSVDGEPLRPSVTVLSHTEVTPSRKYFVTLPQKSKGLPVEYLLTANIALPRSARLSWGLCRGGSRDFSDFEPIRSGRVGMLPNRQYCLQYASAVTRENLTTQMLDTEGMLYQVIDEDGSQAATWASDDVVDVYGNGILIVASQYALDAENGIVNFLTSTLGATITVTVTRPARVYNQVGESTSTVDYRTYLLSNGRFPEDSELVVLVNGSIRRGGWHQSPEDGIVVFDKELEVTDIVTVFVQPSGAYRVGAELVNYGTEDVTLEDFALFYSSVENQSLLYQLGDTSSPSLKANSLRVMPRTQPTVYERLWVDYQFVSEDGNAESGTQITWWRKRTGDATIWPLGEDEDGYHEVTAENGLLEYRNRMTQRRLDVDNGLFAQGDQVRVRVRPSDGITVGEEYISAAVTLLGLRKPYLDPSVSLEIISAELVKDEGGDVVYVKPGYTLTAIYSQIDPDGGPDEAFVSWYERDALLPFASGKTVTQGVTEAGQIISFEVIPYDGAVEGVPGRSGYVYVR